MNPLLVDLAGSDLGLGICVRCSQTMGLAFSIIQSISDEPGRRQPAYHQRLIDPGRRELGVLVVPCRK